MIDLHYNNIILSSPLFSININDIDNPVYYPILPYEVKSFYHIVEPIILRNITFDDEITNLINDYTHMHQYDLVFKKPINNEQILKEMVYDASDYFNNIIDKLRIWLDNKFKETGQKFYAYIAYYIFYACVTQYYNDTTSEFECFIIPNSNYNDIVKVFQYFYENDNKNEFRKAFDPNNDDLTNIFNIASIAYDLMKQYNMSQFIESIGDSGLYSIPFYIQDLYKDLDHYYSYRKANNRLNVYNDDIADNYILQDDDNNNNKRNLNEINNNLENENTKRRFIFKRRG